MIYSDGRIRPMVRAFAGESRAENYGKQTGFFKRIFDKLNRT